MMFCKNSATIALIVSIVLILSGCGEKPKRIDVSIIPAVVVPSASDRQCLKSCAPDFYVDFTEQQRQIDVARGVND